MLLYRHTIVCIRYVLSLYSYRMVEASCVFVDKLNAMFPPHARLVVLVQLDCDASFCMLCLSTEADEHRNDRAERTPIIEDAIDMVCFDKGR